MSIDTGTGITPLRAIGSVATSTYNSIRNAIAMRKAHPSYGYTKADIVADYHTLMGLGMALAALDGYAPNVINARIALEALLSHTARPMSMHGLWMDVKAC